MDFMQMVDSIFQNKKNYHTATDEDKINTFFIVNKKFSLGKLEISQFFNHKCIDKASAMDLWFLLYRNVNKTPGWYWTKNPNKKEDKIKSISKTDKEILMEYYKLSEKDFEFLCEHYRDDVDYKIKILNRV